MRDSFVFYRSYYEAIELLPKSQRADAYRAIFEYMFNGNDITDELKDTAKAIFLMAKPTLEASNKKYEAGKKGAEVKKANKDKADDKQPTKQNGSNVNVNDNVNVNEDNKKEKKIYARDEILEEALNKSDVQVMLNDLGVNETFLYELFHYRQSIGKPILNVKMLIKTLNDFRQTRLKTGKDTYELFEIMQSEGWKNITASYVLNLEKARKQNKDKVQEWVEEAQAEIEAFVNS